MIKVQIGDSRKLIKTIDDSSIDCVVTSPPYWGLRDYGHVDQIGLEDTPEEYLSKLINFFDDVKTKIRDVGSVFVNMGDTYNNKVGVGCGDKIKYGSKNGLYCLRSGTDSLPSKCLCMIPSRFAWE